MTAARSAELVGPSALDLVARRALERLVDLPDVTRAGFAVTEGGRRQLLFTATDRGDDSGSFEWCRIDPEWEVPLNRTSRDGELIAGTLDELEPRFRSFVDNHRDGSIRFIANVPVAYGDEQVGGFVLYLGREPADLPSFRDELLHLGRSIGADLVAARDERRRRAPIHLHGAGTEDRRRAQHEMPGELTAVAAARAFLRATLVDWDLDAELVDDAVLCLGELATNAVVHTHGGCRIHVGLADGVLRVRVVDYGSLGPIRLTPSVDDTAGHGRGLSIVSSIASRSGRDAAECLAWFELDLAGRAGG